MDVARTKLANEFDMEHLMQVTRISHLLAHLHLSRRQRMTVDFFKRYTVRPNQLSGERGMRGMSVENIVAGLHPKNDRVDRRILYELTGVKLTADQTMTPDGGVLETDQSSSFDEEEFDQGSMDGVAN